MTSIAPKNKKSCDCSSQSKTTAPPNDDSLVSKTACTSEVQAKPKRYDYNSQRISLEEYQERNSFTDELVVDYENSSDECYDTTTPSCVVAKPGERLRSRTPSPVKYPGDAEEGELNSPDYVASVQHKTVITNFSDLDEALPGRIAQRSDMWPWMAFYTATYQWRGIV